MKTKQQIESDIETLERNILNQQSNINVWNMTIQGLKQELENMSPVGKHRILYKDSSDKTNDPNKAYIVGYANHKASQNGTYRLILTGNTCSTDEKVNCKAACTFGVEHAKNIIKELQEWLNT